MRADIYDKYISTRFGYIHKTDQIEREYKIYYRYFKKNYLKHLPKDKDARILDVGCGLGHFLYFLESEGYKNYLGIDISGECVSFCKNRGFNVALYDAKAFFKQSNDSFDVIVMNDILEHLEKKEGIRLLTLARERLNENGKLILKVPNASNPIVGLSCRYADLSHEIAFTETSLRQMLRLCGYTNILIYPSDIYIYFKESPLKYFWKTGFGFVKFDF